MSKKSNTINGESIGLGIMALGIMYAYALPDLFGAANPYIAAVFILVGFAGLMTEMAKRLAGKDIHTDNGGIGLLVGVPSVWATYYAYTHFSFWWRIVSILALSILIIVAVAAIFDFIITLFAYLVGHSKGFSDRFVGVVKFLAIIASSVAAVIASLSQVLPKG